MGFNESVKSVFSKYATFSGRASRSEYWYFVLFNVIITIPLFIVGAIIGALLGSGETAMVTAFLVGYALVGIYSLAIIIPSIAVAVRRLHDSGKSGWLYLLVLIPYLGGLVIFVFMLLESAPDNQYGPNPNKQGPVVEVY